MKSWRLSVTILAGLLLGSVPPTMAGPGDVLDTGPPPGPPPFLRSVFPPKLVMEHQQEIGLRAEQADAIKDAMRQTQHALVDLQWRLDAETEALGKLLEADRADEAAVLAKLDEVTSIERQVKKANFALLVKIKNQLDSDQQAKLRVLRQRSRPEPPGPPPPRD